MKRILFTLFMILSILGTPSLEAKESSDSSEKAMLRLFIQQGPQKTYLLGYHWMSLRLHQKIGMVESARRGALKLDAVMLHPAEIYIRELDRLFLRNPELRRLEVGPAIQGLAMSLNDWDSLSDSPHDTRQ